MKSDDDPQDKLDATEKHKTSEKSVSLHLIPFDEALQGILTIPISKGEATHKVKLKKKKRGSD
jgi:hypothetical protein